MQAVIDEYADRGEQVPKNASDDALHSDHVYELSAQHLHNTVTVGEWLEVLTLARTVVVVTAKENYQLDKFEMQGLRGPDKYEAAGINWAGEPPPFVPA